MTFILSPSQNLFDITEKPSKVLQKVQGYTFSNSILAVYNHKKLTIHKISQIQKGQQQQQQLGKLNQADFNKKVETVSIVDDENVIVSDKYGDIFLVKQGADKVFLNENFSIPTLLYYVEIGEGEKVFIVGDQYSKIKVFNYNKPHQIFSIWIPFEATLLQIIRWEDTLAYFVRINKKDTVEVKYKLYTLNVKDLKNENFPGTEVQAFKSEFSDDHYAKIVINNNQIYIVSLQVDKLLIQNIQLGYKLTTKSETTLNIGKQEWNYIDIAYQNQLFIFIGKEKISDNEEQVTKILKQNQNLEIVQNDHNEYLISVKI